MIDHEQEDRNTRAYWQDVYLHESADKLSWFQPESSVSLSLIRKVAPDLMTAILDVGAGASTLVDGLLNDGYKAISVLDLSPAALATARARLGSRSKSVNWIEGDVLNAQLPKRSFDVWHDRALFHFLIDQADQERYVDRVRSILKHGGYAIIATFAEDGPTSCSGLTTARYSAAELHRKFGADFRMIESKRELHRTPWGSRQAFTYCVFQLES